MIATGCTAGQQSTTGGHNGQVAFFRNGLIYLRDGLKAPDVMTYDTPQMGFDASARFRLQLLDQFTDKNGLVIVDYKLTDYITENKKTNSALSSLDPNIPIADNPYQDTNDSAWMTGQALAVVAMAGDMTAAEFILKGMRDHEWSATGDLLRYTDNTEPFKGMDPSTQIAGCYFAWKFAHSAGNQEVQDLAKEVIAKWIDEVYRCNGTLGPGGPKMLLPGLISLDEVAGKMGLDQTRLDNVSLLINEQKVAFLAATTILNTVTVATVPLLSGVTGTLNAAAWRRL